MSDSMFGDNSQGVTYTTIVNNKIAIKVDEEEARDGNGNLKPGYRVRKLNAGPNEGQDRYERVHDYVTGNLTAVEFKPSDYGTQLILTLENGENTVKIQTQGINDNETLAPFAASFGDQAGMIDVYQPIKIGLTKDKTGKSRGVYIEQNGEYFPALHKNERFKAHIAQKPQATKKAGLGGEEKWDYSAPSAWQYNEIQSLIEKLVEKGVGADEASSADEADSGLPF